MCGCAEGGKGRKASGADGQRGCKDVCFRLQYVHKNVGSLRDLS